MTRTAFPYRVDDLSQLARHLQRQLTEAAAPPGHLALMNMLARGAGFRNFQHFRASVAAADRLEAPPAPLPDLARVEHVLRHFDGQGRLVRWPSRTSQQHLAIWGLWSRLKPRMSQTERQLSARIDAWHLFGDAAILRRTMVERGLLRRSPDGSDYPRVEAPPPSEAVALIRRLHGG